MRSILILCLCVGVAGIARVTIGVTFVAGVVGSLPGLLLWCLTGLKCVHLAGN